MATIGSLNIALSASSATLKKDLDKAKGHTKKYSKDVKSSLKSIGSVAASVASAIGTITAAMSIKVVTAYTQEIGNAAAKLRMTGEEYQKLGKAITDNNGNLRALERAVQKSNQEFDNARKAANGTTDSLQRLGLSWNDVADLNTADRIRLVQSRLDNITDETERQALAVKILGQRWNQAIRSTDDLDNAAKGLVVVSQAALDAGANFDTAFSSVKTNIANSIANAMEPVLARLATLSEMARDWIADNEGLFKSILTVTGAVAGLATVLAGLVPLMVTLNVLGGPITLALTAIAAAVAGGIIAWRNWESILSWLKDNMPGVASMIEGVSNALKRVGNGAKVVGGLLKEPFQNFISFLGGAFIGSVNGIFDSFKNKIEAVKDIASGIIEIFKGIVSFDFGQVWEGIKQTFQGVIDWTTSSIKAMWSNISDDVKWKLQDAFADVVNFFGERLVGLINWFKEQLANITAGMQNFMRRMTATSYDSQVAAVRREQGVGSAEARAILAAQGITADNPYEKAVAQFEKAQWDQVPGAARPYGPGMKDYAAYMAGMAGQAPTGADKPVDRGTPSDDGEGSTGGTGGSGKGAGGTSKATKKAGDDAETVAKEVSDRFLGQIKASFSDVLKGNKSFGEFLKDSITSFTNRFWETVSDSFFDTMFEGVKFDDIFKQFGEQLSGMFKNLFGSIQSSLGSMGGAGGGGWMGTAFSAVSAFFGFASGGVVPDTPFSSRHRDSVPAMLTPGEVVLNKSQQEAILSGAGTKGSNQTINVNITGDISRQTKKEIYSMLPEIAAGVRADNKELGFS